MAAPGAPFWVDEMIKVYERKMPEKDSSLEDYRQFVIEMYAYLKGHKSFAEQHQEKCDRQKECPVCGKDREDGVGRSDSGKSVNILIEQPH